MFWATVCPSSGEITIYVTLGTCYSVWMTVCYAGWNETHFMNPYRITSTKCHINTVNSPDDGHIVAQNM